MRIKICGITRPEQGRAIAELGATSLGFICVPQSPRYIAPEMIRDIVAHLLVHGHSRQSVGCIGVFANADFGVIEETVAIARLSGIQLHGDESPEFCRELKQRLPEIELIKAFRVRSPEALQVLTSYEVEVDAFLLDAYHPNLLGGTGKTLDWSSLAQFRPNRPWILAGGLNPENVLEAVQQAHPDGIDLSSGVERSPGDKDIQKLVQLFQQLHTLTNKTTVVP